MKKIIALATFLTYSHLQTAQIFFANKGGTYYKTPRSTDLRDPILRRWAQIAPRHPVPANNKDFRYKDEFPALFATNASRRKKEDACFSLLLDRRKYRQLIEYYQQKVNDCTSYMEKTSLELDTATSKNDVVFVKYHKERLTIQNKNLQSYQTKLIEMKKKLTATQRDLDELIKFS